MVLGVSVICSEPVALFEFGVVAEVFARPHAVPDAPSFETQWCAQTPGHLFRAPLATRMGTPLPLASADGAALVIYIGGGEQTAITPPTRSCLAAARQRGAHLLLLNVSERNVGLAPGPTITACQGNGVDVIRACLTACQHVAGSRIAVAVAARLGVDFEVRQPTSTDSSLMGLGRWLERNLSGEHSVESLASRCGMSPRTFARRFAEEFGTSPGDWLITKRLAYAKTLLTTTGASVDDIARAVGFKSGTLLRHHFSARIGQSPTAFRQNHCTL